MFTNCGEKEPTLEEGAKQTNKISSKYNFSKFGENKGEMWRGHRIVTTIERAQ
jgi:hypothetical protein